MRLADSLVNLELFKGFDLSKIEKLVEGAHSERIAKKQIIFREGDGASRFAIVTGGLLRLTKADPLEDRVAMAFLMRGDLLAALIMPHPTPHYPVTCQATRASAVVWIPRDTYMNKWLGSAELMARVQLAIMDRVQWIHQGRVDQRLPLEARIAGFILKAKERFPNGSSVLGLQLSRQDIADAVGATVESVIRVMANWERKGILETSAQIVEVHQTGILKDIYRTSHMGMPYE